MRNTGAKYVIVFALLISVVALTVGFATYSNTLTIKASADVKGDPTKFNVKLSTVKTGITAGNVAGTSSPSGLTVGTANIAADPGNTISGLKATFTDAGQSVTYKFYAYNAGSFVAYLNSITGLSGSNVKTCTTQSLVDQACNGISVKVRVGGNNGSGGTEYTANNTNISSHSLAKATGEEIFVTISYAAGSQLADGDFTVTLSDIALIYGSAD